MTDQYRPEAIGESRTGSLQKWFRRHLSAALVLVILVGCATDRKLEWQATTLEPQASRRLSPASGISTALAKTPLNGANPGVSTITADIDPKVERAQTSTDPSIPLINSPPVVPAAPLDYPIDLSTALRLAEVENPEIAEARQRIYEALAILQGAQALMIPTLNAGTTYHGHTGNLQRSSGRILNLSEQSLYVGGGARTVAAETIGIPAVNIVSPITDAIYAPLAASQRVDGARLSASATANTILLDVASLHFDLVGAEASLQLHRETEAEGAEFARITRSYAEAGQGRQADANRAATEAILLRREVQRAEEAVAVASTRLARRVHLDPVVRIHSVSHRIEPITLIDLSTPVEDLIQTAVRRRPEVGASAAAIGAAEMEVNQERMRPFLPTLWVGFSGGAMGGGSNLVPPLLGNFGGRTDLDVRLYWTLQNFGIGNIALVKNRQGQVGEAMGEQSAAIARVRREVMEAQSLTLAYRQRIEITRVQLQRAEDGFREELIRLRNTVGRPVEGVTILRLLDRARQDHLRAVIEYDRAQFQLFVALGSPPPLAPGAYDLPLPAAPIAMPPTPAPSRGRSPLGWNGKD